jgi:hypothetical protein
MFRYTKELNRSTSIVQSAITIVTLESISGFRQLSTELNINHLFLCCYLDNRSVLIHGN